jgi:hypothetical protein
MKKTIKVPIYFGTPHIIVSEDLNGEAKKIEPDSNFDGGAFCTATKDSQGYDHYYTALTKDSPPSVVAHEALHCVGFI